MLATYSGRFQPALDLERGDAGAHEVGQHVEAGEILRAEQVAAVAEVNLPAVGDEIVGQAAGLGAFAAVGGAAAERLAGEALAGIGHAERAVHENLQRQRRPGRWRACAARMAAISLREFSRASTTSCAPRSRANCTPAALVTVICVEVWMGKSGESARMSRQMPMSCTMAASTPLAMMVRR
jgi:hypothetical protein